MKTAYISAFILLVLALPTYAQTDSLAEQFPENPQPLKHLLHGGYEVDRENTAKEGRALSKKFLLAHGVYLASNVFDIEMAHQGLAHHNCQEGGFNGDPHPSRGELYAVDMSIFAAVTSLDWVFARSNPPKAFRWMPFMGSTWGTVLHLRGGVQWYTRCW
jgi:hypothetical protein